MAYARRRIRHLHAGVLKILAPGQGGLITTPAVTFPPRRPGRCSVRRQAGGSAEALAGLRAQERKKEKGRTVGETGGTRQSVGLGCLA